MIKAQFVIGQHFLGFDIIKKLKNVILGNPTPKCQDNVIKDKIDVSMSLPLYLNYTLYFQVDFRFSKHYKIMHENSPDSLRN